MSQGEQPADHEGSVPTGRRPPRLFGRSREQGLIHGQLSAALAGSGNIVILGGEAGIGKTGLADDVCQAAARAGAIILVGHCYDFTETPPYGPWAELLEQYTDVRDRTPALSTIPAPQLTHGTSQAGLFGDVRNFFFAIARHRPLVLLLEDVHWADTESFDLIRFVARRLESAPILLVITYRNDEVTRDHPLHRLIPALVREALAVRVDVSSLADDDVRALIDHTYPLPPADADRLAAYLQRRAEGNPFFIGELLRSLEGTVLLPEAGAGWTLGPLDQTRVPRLLRQVIDQRLARLGADAEALLAIGAVIGQQVPIKLWSRVSDATETSLHLLVERAIDANVMDATADGLAARFTHALIRDSLYDGMLPPRRRAWHLKIGEVLAALGTSPDPDEIAYHLSQAGDRRAVKWLTRAGERAQRAYAWRTATQRFDAALALLEHDDAAANDRGWLRFRLALLGRFEDPAAGIALLQEAERLGVVSGDRALSAYARFYQGMLRCQSDDFRLGIAAEEAGIAMLDALSPSDRARLAAIDTTSDPLDAQNGRGELTLALAENGRLHQARALGERIIALPEEQTAGSRGDALYGLGYAYAALGLPDAATTAFSRAREFFAAIDYRSMVTASLFDELMLVTLPYWIDQPNERVRIESELSESFAALHEIFDQRSARAARVVLAVLAGEWADASEILQQNSLRLVRRAIPLLLAPIARHQGNATLAWSLIHQSLPAGPDTAPEDAALDALPLRTLAIALALDAGDFDAARRWLESLEIWLGWSGSVLGKAEANLSWATYHRELGDNAKARERAELALARAATPRQPLALLATHRFLGLLSLAEGRLAEAGEQLDAALALAHATGALHEQALTLLAFGELMLARGNLEGAREHLNTVRILCGPMQAARTLAQAGALEARLQAASPTSAKAAPAGLTPREVDVLRLLATGRPNAEIASQLSLSPRTIDTHLTSIYGKLGVSSRGAAIRFAHENDLT